MRSILTGQCIQIRGTWEFGILFLRLSYLFRPFTHGHLVRQFGSQGFLVDFGLVSDVVKTARGRFKLGLKGSLVRFTFFREGNVNLPRA